ncbi:hypothetical protein [Pseudomonas sp. 273]|uniref:hypothetical protein n=1 Tax=Pseudomonas sp. 273 TaxID=75692 RepID=UPI0023D7CEB4|nr:hypothetical protein [Pseudomonas sp. 273]
MNRLLDFLYEKRAWVLVLLLAGVLLNSLRFLEGWRSLFVVVSGQLWFGYAFHSYISGREILFGPGAISRNDSSALERSLAGGVSFFIYVLFFFFDG